MVDYLFWDFQMELYLHAFSMSFFQIITRKINHFIAKYLYEKLTCQLKKIKDGLYLTQLAFWVAENR